MANRLAQETSPYLLQHANNPVDWYPWGNEAFAKAKAEDKPLLLSIGYAACHWCHVMEHESFEDEDTAALMNDRFVSVKVDREERPDVDSIYMGAVQALTGSGGWPMTVFATPDGVPFLGGTYFPPEDRHGLPGFRTVLDRVDELWRTRRAELIDQGQRIVDAITRAVPAASREPLQPALVAQATGRITAGHDSVNGGFGGPPKFPQAPVLEFLMRSATRSPSVREALERTLRAMALGGMYDQLGGGFARYSVDATWTVPHFEKMLYDNAQLARVYTHAWQAFGDDLYKRIAIETLEYLLRDMRDAAGGFHSSEDADSEGHEGTFYVWDYDEFMSIAPDAAQYYGVTPEGNFEGKNILTAGSPEPHADERVKLLMARDHRVRPGRDDKVLASWNGLAIAALAEAGAAFGRADFGVGAREAAAFVLEHMRDGDELLHTYRGGRAHVRGLLEDYAYTADGLLALWESTLDARYIREARRLTELALRLFGDAAGGFFTNPPDHDLIVRQKEIVESATPAPGAVLSLVAQRLALLFDDPELERTGVDALRTAHAYMDRAPQAVATWLSALDFYVSTPKEIAFTGPLDERLTRVVWQRFLPNRVMAAKTDSLDIALVEDKPDTDVATAYVCERYVCKKPTSDPSELAEQLSG
jgi:uncharacterized protein YyaL (SSP411 family)